MMRIPGLPILVNTAILTIVCIVCCIQVVEAEAQTRSGTAISGVIANMKEVVSFFSTDTYLQLVVQPPDGRLSGGSDSKGRIFYKSELAMCPIPSKGAFTLNAQKLAPGKYVIAVQLLKSSYSATPLLTKGRQIAIVEVPNDKQLPLTIDMGDVELPSPRN